MLGLILNRQNRRTFPRHFLAAVHAELKFATIDIALILSQKDSLKKALVKKGFEGCEEIIESKMSFQSPKGQSPIISQQINPVGLKFTSSSPRMEFLLQPGGIVLSVFDYTGIDDFLRNFKQLFDVLAKSLKIIPSDKINSVGLRKIDSIIIEPVTSLATALSIFNPALFCSARAGIYTLESFKISEEVTVLEQDKNASIIKARLIKNGPQTLEAILDFDLISVSEAKLNHVFSSILPKLNQTHFDLFMWAITKDMISLMEQL